MVRNIKKVTALDAVTETTTSNGIAVQGAKKITFAFTRADHGSGNTVFTVMGTIDGTNYYALNKLVKNVANSNSEQLTRVASITLSSNTTEIVSLDLQHDSFEKIKVKATETTDGTHTAKVLIQY